MRTFCYSFRVTTLYCRNEISKYKYIYISTKLVRKPRLFNGTFYKYSRRHISLVRNIKYIGIRLKKDVIREHPENILFCDFRKNHTDLSKWSCSSNAFSPIFENFFPPTTEIDLKTKIKDE